MQELKLDSNFEIKQFTEDDKYGYFEGYASVFEVIDSYRDVVKKGAFQKSIENRKNKNDTNIPMLWSHETDNPIGFFDINSIFEDEIGLFVKGKILLNIPQGRTAYNLIKAGVCKKMSIGYIVKKDFYNESNKTRELLDIELHEISLVMFPANDSAKILNVKNINLNEIKVSSPEKIINKKDIEQKLNNILKNEEFKDEDFYLLANGEKKYGLFIDINNEGEPEINIKSLIEFSRKDNIDTLNISENERLKLKEKINLLFDIIRKNTNDNSYISPYENQQNIIKNFTIKDCERFLKKSGLTNSGFKTFFSRLAELKACGTNRKKPKKELEDLQESSSENSLDENDKTPEELEKFNQYLKNLSSLLKNKE